MYRSEAGFVRYIHRPRVHSRVLGRGIGASGGRWTAAADGGGGQRRTVDGGGEPATAHGGDEQQQRVSNESATISSPLPAARTVSGTVYRRCSTSAAFTTS